MLFSSTDPRLPPYFKFSPNFLGRIFSPSHLYLVSALKYCFINSKSFILTLTSNLNLKLNA